MRLFLDSSVLLAACGSAKGASRLLFDTASASGWSLLATPYVADEVLANIVKLTQLTADAGEVWDVLRRQLIIVPDVVTVDRPVVFSASKDRPILQSALAWADVL